MKPIARTVMELRGVSKTYRIGAGEVRAMQSVSLRIEANEFVAIMGPSGSGKSTMLHILGLLDRTDEGEYLLLGRNVSTMPDDERAALRNQSAGFVFQQFHLLPRISALQNVALPLIYNGRGHLREKAEAKIAAVGLADRSAHKPNELSGGQQQRVAIARALVNDPPILFADEPTGNLDSKSEKEIMDILCRLHAQGKTIVMVTHEPEIARQADRIITMRDGRIVGDKKQRHTQSRCAESDAAPASPQIAPRLMPWQEWRENILQGFSSLLANKLRSLLSMLGIMIGVASVIAMLALGKGAEVSMRERMASLGTNLLSVRSGGWRHGGAAQAAGSVTRFTLQDGERIAQLPDIKNIAPNVMGRAQVVYGNTNWNTGVRGTSVSYAGMRSAEPVQGRFFTREEVDSRARVAVLGATVVRELFGDQDPLGQIIRINRIQFSVIGVLPKKGEGFGGDQDDIVVAPVTTVMYRMLGKRYVDFFDVEVAIPQAMDQAQEAIRKLLVQRHSVRPEHEDDAFSIRNMAEIQEALSSVTRTMTMLLGFIAAISLLVGGIGIMNIMLVSVTERTREIGLRKAIGARRRDIMFQFLIEATVMTVCGGIMGILLGIGSALALTLFTGWAVLISPAAVAMVTLFSMLVGLVFGLWPARKAADLNPIEALRYE